MGCFATYDVQVAPEEKFQTILSLYLRGIQQMMEKIWCPMKPEKPDIFFAHNPCGHLLILPRPTLSR